jgi:hypothetical protein
VIASTVASFWENSGRVPPTGSIDHRRKKREALKMEVKSTELTFTNVLDQYYSWLVKLMGPRGNDRVALFSTIVTHDIVRNAPLYTEGVFRGFADRTLTISPEDFGPGNTTDRYSRRYADLINVAAYELYASANYTAAQTIELQKLDGEVTEAIKEINSTRRQANAEWATFAQQLGVKPGTPEYDLERANFYLPYLTIIRDQRMRITRAQSRKLAVHMSVFRNDRDAAKLSRIYERCQAQDSIQYLPTNPDIEAIYRLDPIKIAEAAQSGLYAFETELGVDPSGSLVRMLDGQGTREITIDKTHTADFSHDRSWNVGGSASSWIPIFSANVSAQSESHFRQSILNIESIKISCDYMGEYWVRRRDWFDSTIFTNKYVAEELKNQPAAAALLALCVSSAVIVRGLKVTYKFKSVDDTTIWSSWSGSAGGNFSAWGFNFGLSGGASGSDRSHVVNTLEKSVTFFDSPDVCRLVALRASQLIPTVTPEAIAFAGKRLEESELGVALVNLWRDGEVPFGQVPEKIASALRVADDIELRDEELATTDTYR